MTREMKNIFGMELECWTHESCEAEIAEGDNWATIYHIQSKEEGKGHATALLKEAKSYYEKKGKVFGSSVSLSPVMSHLLKKLEIKEYE